MANGWCTWSDLERMPLAEALDLGDMLDAWLEHQAEQAPKPPG